MLINHFNAFKSPARLLLVAAGSDQFIIPKKQKQTKVEYNLHTTAVITNNLYIKNTK